MYSWEIQNILQAHNYIIPDNIYIEICKSSQISRIKYEPFGDYFEIWTNDNCYWKLKVLCRKEI